MDGLEPLEKHDAFVRKEGFDMAAREIADAIEAEALRMRREDFRSGKAGIEYINGFEDAARIAREVAS